MNPTLRRALGTVAAAGVALTGSLAVSPLAVGAETDSSSESATASATTDRTDAQNDAIVRAMYLGFLDREPTAAEATAGRPLAADSDLIPLVRKVSTGDEWLGVFVDDLYDQALGRAAEGEGRTYWIGQMGEGKPSTLIAASVIGSPEFRALAGETDEDFVKRNYDRVLKRNFDQEGLDFWIGQVSAIGFDGVGAAFFESEENRNRRVTNLYNDLLCRGTDAAGLAYWAEQIKNGRDIALSENIAVSTEFVNNAIAGECLATTVDPDPDPDPDTPPDPATVCTGVSGMPNEDCQALVKIYNANGGTDWAADYDDWTTDNNACAWQGITCLDGKLTQIAMNGAGITGDLDASAADLTDLTHLNVSGNEITSFPAGMDALGELRFLNVAYNDLTSLGGLDSAPKVEEFTATNAGLSDAEIDVSAMGELIKLWVNNNPGNTDGAPNTLTSLPLPTATDKLERVEAQFNQITDISGVEAMTQLDRLWLFNNQLGAIPVGISALTNLADDTAAPGSTDSLRVGPQCPGATANAADTAFLDAKDAGWDDAGVLNGDVCAGA